MKVLHLDTNHQLLIDEFARMGYENHEDYSSTKEKIEESIGDYDGIIIRSRIPIDKPFLEKAVNLKFIGRVGAGLENIDIGFAKEKNIFLANAPEGNRNAVGEHALGMLLSLMNNMTKSHREVRKGIWDREGNRGTELDGKIVGIIGYGNMGKAFAQKLRGFNVEVICYDLIGGVGDENARQVGILELQQKSDVISLHVPLNPYCIDMVIMEFIYDFHKPFWFLNTARGKCVVTKDLVAGLKTGKILGAGLDVLEYEKKSFDFADFFSNRPKPFKYLRKAPNVLMTPHVAGWTVESKEKLAQTIVDKIKAEFS